MLAVVAVVSFIVSLVALLFAYWKHRRQQDLIPQLQALARSGRRVVRLAVQERAPRAEAAAEAMAEQIKAALQNLGETPPD